MAIFSDSDEYVKKNCATLIREVAKHTPEVTQYVPPYYTLCRTPARFELPSRIISRSDGNLTSRAGTVERASNERTPVLARLTQSCLGNVAS